MNIGVLGTGDVGKKLGTGFISIGHSVMLGSRDPNSEKVKSWIAANGKNASGGTLALGQYGFRWRASAALAYRRRCRQSI